MLDLEELEFFSVDVVRLPRPTQTGVRPDMLLNREETLGSVAPILTFDSDEEGIEIAN